VTVTVALVVCFTVPVDLFVRDMRVVLAPLPDFTSEDVRDCLFGIVPDGVHLFLAASTSCWPAERWGGA
jgi:hypothetical protein